MREIIDDIQRWKAGGKQVAVATIVKANGSPMRPIGSKMAVTTDQQISGSVTGGCIESAVYEEAQEVIRSGKAKTLRYGIANDQTPWEIGLSCGSSLDIFVESMQHHAWQMLFPSILRNHAGKGMLAVVTLLSGEAAGAKMLVWPCESTEGSLGSLAMDNLARDAALVQLQARDPKVVRLDEEHEVFIDVLVPPARMVIVGAAHVAIPLVTLGRTLGFTTLVLDPRKAFATRERFPDADVLLTGWPADEIEKLEADENTFVAVVSHDDKLDNPALAAALKTRAAYVGVLGTRRNVPKRLDALRELGVTEEQLKRLHAPIGLEIGAVQPEEIALSVLAEMVAVQHGRESGGALHTKSVL